VTALYADEATNGLCTVGFKTRFSPNGTETTVAGVVPDSSGKTELRFTARQMDMLITFNADNTARWGAPRLEIKPGGER
jgi:hypothetical protein